MRQTLIGGTHDACVHHITNPVHIRNRRMVLSSIRHYGDSVFLYTTRGRKFLGKMGKNNDGVSFFMTHIKDPERHLMKIYHGYCLNLSLLNALMNMNISNIIIPEDAKQGFRGFISTVYQYLTGVMVFEDEDEQRCVDVDELRITPLDKTQTRHFLQQ